MEQTVSSADGNDSQQLASLIDQEDQARSSTYMILASLLSDIPSQDLIDYLCHIESPENGQDPGEIGVAWQRLKQEALNLDMEKLDDEYHALFIGVGRGEIVQYGSWHLTGFLMDTPLSELRDDLRSLGFESNPDQKEPEDHISAICETMSILINSDDIESYQQRRFFIRHLHPWAEKFFRELQSAKSANFYQAVGMLGERFIKLENLYLNIQEH
ncbi:MAG: molecular chaperone TorD family protein [Arenicellales bacterium]